MPQFETLTTADTLATAMVIAVLLGLAGLLLVWLASLRFPRFRTLVCWSLARWLDPSRFDEGTCLHELALAVAVWLDPWQHRFTLAKASGVVAAEPAGAPVENWPAAQTGRRDYQLGTAIGTSKSYRAIVTEDQSFVIKLAVDTTGDRLLAKEASALDRLRYAAADTSYLKYLPQRVERFRAGGRVAVAYPHDADRWRPAPRVRAAFPDGLGGEHVAWMFNRMLEIIGFAHRQGMVHGAVMPQHLLFDLDSHGLQLVDWTHAERIGGLITFIPRRYRRWHPRRGVQVAEPSLDIYMAARSALFLAGSDSASVDDAGALPKPMRRFFQSCLLESANMRPCDAWELHEEFRDLLAALFGEPSFRELPIGRQAAG